ncbi:uncharacterized protein NEMAJ01_0626 [Nematocida major]|uniref:uncharacterized protein n=1 Tax=Nematocida major TaxID=1912982 RepID=UPI002007C339|nr:uncharacterized protein NEMAJ01_0626 [Nematocida major]KAH9385730.1 hypothetical protein NEMAJ01_0626 [Nematocida major]
MFIFVALSLLIVLSIAFYIRRSILQQEKADLVYDNAYLKEYLELSPEASQLDHFNVLTKASIYLIEKEEELENETKALYSLFYARMVSNTLWEQLKKAKDELHLDKITIEAELGRYAKLDKSSIERHRKRPEVHTKEKLSYAFSNSELKELYERIKKQ